MTKTEMILKIDNLNLTCEIGINLVVTFLWLVSMLRFFFKRYVQQIYSLPTEFYAARPAFKKLKLTESINEINVFVNLIITVIIENLLAQ